MLDRLSAWLVFLQAFRVSGPWQASQEGPVGFISIFELKIETFCSTACIRNIRLLKMFENHRFSMTFGVFKYIRSLDNHAATVAIFKHC